MLLSGWCSAAAALQPPMRTAATRHRTPPAAMVEMPPVSPTGVTNRLWRWRGYDVRYQCLGEEQEGPSLLLVHGLFVNADHWRRNLPALAAAGCRVYAIDLLGSVSAASGPER